VHQQIPALHEMRTSTQDLPVSGLSSHTASAKSGRCEMGQRFAFRSPGKCSARTRETQAAKPPRRLEIKSPGRGLRPYPGYSLHRAVEQKAAAGSTVGLRERMVLAVGRERRGDIGAGARFDQEACLRRATEIRGVFGHRCDAPGLVEQAAAAVRGFFSVAHEGGHRRGHLNHRVGKRVLFDDINARGLHRGHVNTAPFDRKHAGTKKRSIGNSNALTRRMAARAAVALSLRAVRQGSTLCQHGGGVNVENPTF
jgi:hypothetical protein